jgi:hypothetical protein
MSGGIMSRRNHVNWPYPMLFSNVVIANEVKQSPDCRNLQIAAIP